MRAGGVGVGDERVVTPRKIVGAELLRRRQEPLLQLRASTGTFAFCAVTLLISIAKRATVS